MMNARRTRILQTAIYFGERNASDSRLKRFRAKFVDRASIQAIDSIKFNRGFHVRAPICLTSSCTSNGSPFFKRPTGNFFIGNVAVIWKTAS